MSRRVPWILTVLAVAGAPALAFAQDPSECATDADCDAGFVCEVTGASTCAAPGCRPGEECPPPPPCETEEYRSCVPGPCEVDADCGGDLVCLEVGYTECSGGGAVPPTPACRPGEECPPPPEPEPVPEPTCEEHVERFCGPRYAAPCTADADCGAGFTCVATETCTCSSPTPVPDEPAPMPGGEGSGDGGGEDGGAPVPGGEGEPGGEPDCECGPSGVNHCEPIRVDCASSADCLEGWTCEDIADRPPCASTPPSDPGDDPGGEEGGGGVPGGEGETPPDCGEPPAPENVCLPPYWEVGFGESRGGSDVDDGGPATGEEGTPTGPSPSPEPPTLGDPMDPAGAPGDGASSSEDGGSCSAAGGPASGGVMAIGWLAALWAVTRRRRRAV